MEIKSGSHQNLLGFVRINLLVLLVWQFFSEMKGADGSYWLDYVSPVSPILPSNLLILDWIPSWLPHTWAYVFVAKWLLPLGMVFGLFFPQRRLGFISAFLLLFLKTAFEHSSTSVVSTLCLIPLLLLCIQPPAKEYEHVVRARLVLAYSAMYLLSVLAKTNINFLSGQVFAQQDFLVLLREPFAQAYGISVVPVIAAVTVYLLQLVASFLWFSRARKYSMIASLIFHTAVSLTIMRSLNLLLIGASFVLLFETGRTLRTYYLRLACFILVTPVLLFASAKVGAFCFDAVCVALALTLAAFQFIEILRMSKSTQNFRSYLGAILPAVYFLLALFFAWPEPLGYAQYSGRNRVYTVVKMISLDPENSQRNALLSRWSVRFHVSDPTTLTAFLPSAAMVTPFINRMCSLHPRAQYFISETAPIFPTREDLRNISENLEMKEIKKCGPSLAD